MSKSFQKEKPPARINLFLEVQKNGALEKKELPLRMMMVGDYTGREDDTPLEDREILNINKDNFDAVMGSMDLGLEYDVANEIKDEEGAEMKVNLTFEEMKDFHPEQVARQIPEINHMLAMRNLLQDLRNRVVSMSQFRKQLEEIVKDEAALEKLAAELNQFVIPEDEEAPASDD